MQSATNCPRCGQPLTYVYQYQQWYCPAEGVYPWAAPQQAQTAPAQAAPAAKEAPVPQAAEPAEPTAPATQAVPQATASQACPRCGRPLTYVHQYQQWYCPAEGVYPWATQQAQPAQTQAAPAAQPSPAPQAAQAAAQPVQQATPSQACPRCGQALTYVYQYQRWYCPSEGIYPWG